MRFIIGGLVSFLQFIKTINQPVSQIAQQLTSVILASAGAERVFKLLDEVSEFDEGYVTLVNAKFNDKNKIEETPERTGIWAWKHPHKELIISFIQVDLRISKILKKFKHS
nr:hypothetical protein [uncultured Leptotrichia sp.]